ncbi:Ig-like domain-containing protein, partial [bacterium]|nr:Ig-like domain-containing protein [bacterium]
MTRQLALFTAAIVLCSLLTSCGGDDPAGIDPSDAQAPTVVATSIANGATDVSLIERIEFTFSEDMDAATINDTTFLVAGRSPHGIVEYDASSRTATVVPDTLYNAGIWHSARVTTGATDTAGNPAVPETLTFQTGTLDREHVVDWMEPNESTAGATPVSVDVLYHTLSGCDTDDDYFRFTLTETKKITVKTPIIYAPIVDRSPGWNTYFLQEDGDEYATRGTSAHTGETPSFFHTFLPGTYYVRIYNSYGLEESGFILYDVEFETGIPCQDDVYEDNDFGDEAAALAIGQHDELRGCYVDADHFTFEMAAGDTLAV